MTSTASRLWRHSPRTTTARQRNSSATSSAIISVQRRWSSTKVGASFLTKSITPTGAPLTKPDRARWKCSRKRYRYTGKERDAETGLNYHGARYYAPWLGRWMAADPIGLQDGVNLYGYVSCNPVAFFDPTGTQGRWYNRFEEAVTFVEDQAYVLGESLESAASTVEEGADVRVT